jgi:hypothetical protein
MNDTYTDLLDRLDAATIDKEIADLSEALCNTAVDTQAD